MGNKEKEKNESEKEKIKKAVKQIEKKDKKLPL